MAALEGYRTIKIRVSQQVVDVPIPVATVRVGNGNAEYVDGQKEHGPLRLKATAVRSEPVVETAALDQAAQTAARKRAPLRSAR